MSEDCLTILLNEPSYTPGSTAIGKVVAKITQNREATDLTLSVNGKACTDFLKAQENHYKDLVNYIDHQTTLWQSPPGEEMIAAREYWFPFQFLIPDEIPINYEGRFGHIRYEITVELNAPSNLKNNLTSTITLPLTLGYCSIPPAIPLRNAASQDYGFCCTAKVVAFEASITTHAYALGQLIPIKLIITNPRDVKLKSLETSIKYCVTFHGKSSLGHLGTLEDFQIVNQQFHDIPLNRKRYDGVINHVLEAPTPTNFSCTILKVDAFLNVAIRVKSTSSDLEVCLPITLVEGFYNTQADLSTSLPGLDTLL